MKDSNASPYRILFVEHNVDGTVGGSHYCLLDICRLIDKDRFTPIAWFFQPHSLLTDFQQSGATIIVERPPLPIRLADSTSRLLSTFSKVAQSIANLLRTLTYNVFWWLRRLRQLRPHLVHMNNNCAGDVDLQIAAYLLRIPVVSHQRGFAGPIAGLPLALVRRQRAVIAISSSVRDYLVHAGLHAGAVRLIFDGVDPQRLDSATSLTEPVVDVSVGPIIGIVGNIKPWKGQEIVIRAMRIVVEQLPTVRCWIIGAEVDLAYTTRLHELIVSLSLENNVAVLGYRKDSSRLMRQMDVVVHASIEPEPFGIVLLEAMHHAKPVIATAHGGPMDIVVHAQTGLLTPPGDHEELGYAIMQLLRYPDMAARMGAAGKQRLAERFAAVKTVSCMESLFNELLSS